MRTAREIEQQYGEPLRDMLYRLYVVEKQSTHAISQILPISQPAVISWIKKLAIPYRTKSAACALRNAEWVRNDPEREQARNRKASIASNMSQSEHRVTSIERAIKDRLDAAGIAYTFQYLVDRFIADFYIPAANLIVECDGVYWHSLPKAQKNDAAKDVAIAQHGYALLRLPESRILSDPDGCIRAIQALIG
jgi:very-short-patch-repair endonuclease